MALFFNLFNTPRPKQFNYRPMYYDERKERLEKMKAEAEAARDGIHYRGLQKGFLSEQRTKSKLRRASLEKASTLRFLLILLILLLLLYFIMPEIFSSFWKMKN